MAFYNLITQEMGWEEIKITKDQVIIIGYNDTDKIKHLSEIFEYFTLMFSFDDVSPRGFTITEFELLFTSDSGKRTIGYGTSIKKLVEPGQIYKDTLPLNYRRKEAGGISAIDILLSGLYIRVSRSNDTDVLIKEDI
ncbi:hypothetical protein RF11_04703 [Thelohanellus kitauei]|uniref:Uncharacterized protein n=1 Tax=Thelohanellus kitauei TaxID=669202 RepID=A0A0C2N137_THEKT|nr:hypothetical protein RF11_04703 [Thelohanellus kitauei]